MRRFFVFAVFLLCATGLRAQQAPFPGQPAGVNGSVQCNGNGVFALCPDITDLGSTVTVTGALAATGGGTFSGTYTFNNGLTVAGGRLAANLGIDALVSISSPQFFSINGPAPGTGLLRLASVDTVCWRNNANSADLCLSKNASDNLLWPNSFSVGGTLVSGSGGGSATLPNNTGTVGELNLAQTWTANQTLNNASQLLFLSTNGTNFAGFQGGASTVNLVWKLPATDSTGTQCISSNGSQQLSFSACSGGTGTPGGSNNHVQYNASGSFAGSADLTWNNTTATLTIGAGGAAVGILTLENGIVGQSINVKALGTTSGTYNFNLPAAAGTAGQPLLSGGGGTNAQTYGTLGYGGGGTGGTSFSANQLVTSGASVLSSLAGTTTGTNPILKLQPSSASNTALTVDTASTPTADILDVNINTVKTSWFDSSAFLHTPQTTYTGSGALTLSGNEGTCPAPASGQDIICLGDSAAHVGKISNNGVTFKSLVDWVNDSPVAHGVALVSSTLPQLNYTSAGATGVPLVGQGATSDPIFSVLGVAGGGTGDTTLTAHGVLLGEGTSAVAATAAGTSGQAFLSGGASADGAYGAFNLAGGSSIVTGTLPIADGGTGATTLAGANIVTQSGAFTPGNCLKSSSSTVVTDAGAPCGSGGSVALSAITNATGSNTLTNGVNPQTWNWALTGSTTAFKFGETSAATSTNNILEQVTTLSASTAIPFQADNNGNGWQLSSTGQLQRVGTASLAIPGTAHGVVVSEGNSTAIVTTAAGTSGQLLTSGGASADPTYTFPSTTVNGATCTIASTCTVTLDAIGNPVANASFTFPATEGLTVAGTQPASVSGAGTAAGTVVTITAPKGGNSTSGTGGQGGTIQLQPGVGGDSTTGEAPGGLLQVLMPLSGAGGTGQAFPGRFLVDYNSNGNTNGTWTGSSANAGANGNAGIFARNTASTASNTVNNVSPAIGLTAHMQIGGVDTEVKQECAMVAGVPGSGTIASSNANNSDITILCGIPAISGPSNFYWEFEHGGIILQCNSVGGSVCGGGSISTAGAALTVGHPVFQTANILFQTAGPGAGNPDLIYKGHGNSGTNAACASDDNKATNGTWVWCKEMVNNSGGNLADGTVVKMSGTADQITSVTTTDPASSVVGIVVVPQGGNCANAATCHVAYAGTLRGVVKMGTASCSIGNGIAPDTTTAAEVKCLPNGIGPSFAIAESAQATPGNTVDLFLTIGDSQNNLSRSGPVHQTAQTGAISTATLCAALTDGCGAAGMYHIHFSFIETGTACGTPGTGGVTFLLTWTDTNGTTHSAVSLGMDDASAINAVSQTFHFQATLAAAWASGDFNVSTNGSVIQYATGYTACGIGTGTYQVDAVATKLQ